MAQYNNYMLIKQRLLQQQLAQSKRRPVEGVSESDGKIQMVEIDHMRLNDAEP